MGKQKSWENNETFKSSFKSRRKKALNDEGKIDESTQEKSQHETFIPKRNENGKFVKGKFVVERAQNRLCAQHAKIYPSLKAKCVYTIISKEKKEKSSFLHYFLMEYSWEPSMFHVFDGIRFLSEETFSVKPPMCIFHLSVVSFSGRRTYSIFPTVLYFCFVSTIHNSLCCVYIFLFFLAPQT